MSAPLLKVADLTLALDRHHGGAVVVDRVSFEVAPGQALGIVGESGSGKSLTLRAAMGLLPAAVQVRGGSVSFAGEALAFAGRAARRQRRRQLTMVFQDSLSALDPVYTVGSQIAEVGRHVMGLSRAKAWARAVELLELVGIREPQRRAHAYPHELSGGMRQRAMLAIALATEPRLLLCDEPTTALDVTVQAQVLELLARLRRELGSLVFVSHDLAVVRQICEDLVVMYTGRLVEAGPTADILAEPLHPYTQGLLAATLDLGEDGHRPRPIPGSIPEPGRLPSGCSFRPRCSFATEACAEADMSLQPATPAAADARPGTADTQPRAGGAVGTQSTSPATASRRSACIHWQELAAR